MASLTQWTWVWASSGRWWRTGRPGVLQSMGTQRVGHGLSNWTELYWYVNMYIKSTPYLIKNLFYWGMEKILTTKQYISFTETQVTSNSPLVTLLLKPSSSWNTVVFWGFFFHFSHLSHVLFSRPFVLFPTLYLCLSLPLTYPKIPSYSFLLLLLLSPPLLPSPAQFSEVIYWFLLPSLSRSWLLSGFFLNKDIPFPKRKFEL